MIASTIHTPAVPEAVRHRRRRPPPARWRCTIARMRQAGARIPSSRASAEAESVRLKLLRRSGSAGQGAGRSSRSSGRGHADRRKQLQPRFRRGAAPLASCCPSAMFPRRLRRVDNSRERRAEMADHIFHDPTGRRERRARLGVGLLVSLAALIVAGFFATLAFAPRLPTLSLKDPRVLQALHVETAHRLKGKPAWTHVPRRPHAGEPGGADAAAVGRLLRLLGRRSSRASLAPAHRPARRRLAAVDRARTARWDRSTVTSDPQAEAIIASAKNAPSVLPMVHNAHDGLFDGPLANNLLLNPAARTALVTNLVTLAKSHGYGGYVFDFENLSPQALAHYPALLAQARAALKPLGREVWVTAPVRQRRLRPEEVPGGLRHRRADGLRRALGRRRRAKRASPGRRPARTGSRRTSSATWRQLDPAHTVVALGDYGYDWTLGKDGKAVKGDTEVVLRRHPDGARLRRAGQPRRRRAEPDLRLRRRRRRQAHRLVPGRRHRLQRDQGRRRLPAARLRAVADGRRGPGGLELLAPALRLGQADRPGDHRARHRRRLRRHRARCCTSAPRPRPASARSKSTPTTA